MQKISDVAVVFDGTKLVPIVGAIITIVNVSGGSNQMYSDAGITAIANTVTDTNGGYSFYANDGVYDLTVTSGTLIGTRRIYVQDTTDIAIAQDLRLTLTSGVPVTTADITAAPTIYLTPYKGNKIGLNVGGTWQNVVTAEISLVLAGLTAGTPYDIFCYSGINGMPTLETLIWTNGTTRATALSRNAGILVKSTDISRRYLGTFIPTAAATTEDSVVNRYLWNYYNRAKRYMERHEVAASWAYTVAVVRQANANVANQLNFVIGISEDTVSSNLITTASNNTAGVVIGVGIGLDSTTVVSPDALAALIASPGINYNFQLAVSDEQYVTEGKHFLAWLEYSTATGITTWVGAPAGVSNSGIMGTVWG